MVYLTVALIAGYLGNPLTYNPVTPCRIADTRVTTIINRPVSGITAFLVRGDASRIGVKDRGYADPISYSFEDQGGEADGCGIPLNALAVKFTLTVLPLQGRGGHLIAWKHEIEYFLDFWPIPVPRKPPKAATLTWNSSDKVSTVGALIEVCDPETAPFEDCNEDILVAPFGSAVHLVIDVEGYFTR